MIPDHYRLDPSPQKVISKWGLTFAAGNVIKYMVRAGKKANAPVLVDWRKALDNLLIVGLERGLSWAEVASEASASCGWAAKVWAGPIDQADLDKAAEIVVEDADALAARVAELEEDLSSNTAHRQTLSHEITEMQHWREASLKTIARKDRRIEELEAEVARLRAFNPLDWQTAGTGSGDLRGQGLQP